MADVTTRVDQSVDYSPLTPACVKALTDKIEEKRRFAASEIEKMTVELSMTNNLVMINRLIIVLQRFCLSLNSNSRKGGLIGMASVMVGFKNGSDVEPPAEVVEEVTRPILTCFLDSDPKVRYLACESLYMITKVARSNILPLFEAIFDNLAKIVADPDSNVRTAAQLLDTLLKDIVLERKSSEINCFLPKFEEYIYTNNPFTRMFILCWIRILDTNKVLDTIGYLPNILDGVFNCLNDSNKEIRAAAVSLLSEFLSKIVSSPTESDFVQSLINIILKHIKNDNQDAQFTTIAWLRTMIRLLRDHDLRLSTNENIDQFIQSLYKTFRDNESVFEDHGTFVILNLCVMIEPEIMYRSFAGILINEKKDDKFAYNLVQKLNEILLTTQPLHALRSKLNSESDSETVNLFQVLYQAWCHSSIAALTLCLLTNNHEKASQLVDELSKLDITIDILAQVDWVVQLIESPVFASLRMRLLDSSNNHYLLQSLFGLMMILPQSEAYRRLANRLDQVYKFMYMQSQTRPQSTDPIPKVSGASGSGSSTIKPRRVVMSDNTKS